ncbi:drug/metabolite transporter (DMT)-like permease [Anaerosolibacter carboniphilus]|uniref:Drug/metabolite transporter (DMT)-like permease n=1 Tax=Anaerosolibacter carboniphilus TaxID=1417629 RepID=A0A841KZ83_9FIRM|nr:DMT family transporter [Anaerosolibacter carboniphilus]MBB6218934.1 drug/metabolite transporter (DMT)-like permease [Anaerosolibacter carboniphilus]
MRIRSKGIFFILLSSFFFSIMAIAVKSIPEIPVAEKIFFRNILGVLISALVLYKNKECFSGNNRKLLLTRSIFGVLGVATYYYTIGHLPLSDAVILNKLSPFFVILLAYIFLDERIKKLQIPAFIIAILGTIFIVKPQFDYTFIPSMIGILSAIFAAGAYIVIRQLQKTDSTHVIVFHFCLFSCLAVIPFMVAGQFILPNLKQLVALIIIGLSATTAQFSMTHSYRYALASQLTIYNYADIIFSTILGMLLWAEFPDLLSITGGLLVIIAGIFNYLSSTQTDEANFLQHQNFEESSS